ncbi:hypothetical protein OG792_32740 [Micromonospora sp. NBC_01699]|uniref:hypothetical protein n=1 Tax=Micromonospora sp. NBC_01699 TaxID=2975984 RepID=UPI002E2C640F|nr:hypothetical protein [Micromonospora sp. NBC_01699]
MSNFSAVAAITARMVGASPAEHPFVSEPMSVEFHEAVARLLNEIDAALTAFQVSGTEGAIRVGATLGAASDALMMAAQIDALR